MHPVGSADRRFLPSILTAFLMAGCGGVGASVAPTDDSDAAIVEGLDREELSDAQFETLNSLSTSGAATVADDPDGQFTKLIAATTSTCGNGVRWTILTATETTITVGVQVLNGPDCEDEGIPRYAGLTAAEPAGRSIQIDISD